MRRANITQDLYMGFDYHITHQNPAYKKDIYDSLAYHGDDFAKLTGLDRGLHHSFLYYGDRYASAQHLAPVQDWFIQIANAKLWRFVDPSYSPYMRMVSKDSYYGWMSGRPYLRNETNIPYLDVQTNPGDLMFFPRVWWHEVHNVHPNTFGLGIGFRPHKSIVPLKYFVFPWIQPPGQMPFQLTFPGIFISKAVKKILQSQIWMQGKIKSGLSHHRGGMPAYIQRIERRFGELYSWGKYPFKGQNLLINHYSEADRQSWREEYAEILSEHEFSYFEQESAGSGVKEEL